MDKNEIREKFQKLKVWQDNDERAVHKPLLVLYAIGKLLQEEKRQLSFVDIEDDLQDLLIEFGPWRKNYRPQDPFWRLKNDRDKVWEIPNEYKIREGKRKDGKSTGDARIGDLRRFGEGGFLEPISQTFEKDPEFAFEIAKDLLIGHFPPSYHDDILLRVGIPQPKAIRPNQLDLLDFYEKVLKAYEYKCAVCGFDVRLQYEPIALDVSYIKWEHAGGPETENNGLALCSIHHKLFDRGVFSLTTQLEVLVSEYANGNVGLDEWLMRFNGEKINSPLRQTYFPNEEYLSWHYKEVFKGPYREIV